ncbi:MAG: beta-lactamase family protein [Ruminococcaceae bacterium]|nr:beta-lactamase family protein [Oscillospiraceae bacterium]
MNFQSLTDFLNTLPSLGVPGTDCVIYHKRKEVYRHQSGFMDIEQQIPMALNAIYNMYSATKPVTCTAALQLYERGLFTLSDPLYAYIPAYKTMYIKENGSIRKAEKPILIRDLFTMTAGFDYNIRSDAITSVKRNTNGAAPTLAVVRALATEPLSFEPGTRFQYSLCHDVLGGLVEVLSGKTLGQYCREHIFEPLGMQDTTFLPTEETEERLAPLYMHYPDKKRTVKISSQNVFRFGTAYESGGGGLLSTTEDSIRFVDMLASGGRTQQGELVLSRGTISLMRTNQVSPTALYDFGWTHMAGYGYGLGVRTMIDKEKSGSLGSLYEFGWGGAAGAYMLADTERELAVFYTQHMLESMEAYIHPRLRNYVYEGIDA